MTRTTVRKHSRKGTKGVKKHSRTTKTKKTVPHTRKKRKSYKISTMTNNEIEDRLHALFIHSNNTTPSITDARDVYNELGLNLQYEGFTRIGQIIRFAGLNTYYIKSNPKYNEKETVKFLKANLNEERPAFNKLGKGIITDREYSTGNFERGDQLIDEFAALYGARDLEMKWVKEHL